MKKVERSFHIHVGEESRETLTYVAGLVGIVSLNVAHVATDLELCEYGCD